MVRILVFSGTSDGRVLSQKLAEMGAAVTVSVATEYGEEEQKLVEGVSVQRGRLDTQEMAELLRDMDLCIDATHPYATEVTANIQKACQMAEVPYKRLGRSQAVVEESELVHLVSSPEEAVEYLKNQEGRIMLTTGSKDLPIYQALGGERLVPRVLPTHQGITACEEAGIPHRNIIAMQGPFSEDLNLALLKQFSVDLMVTKESGKAGGFAEKMAAAKAMGVRTVVIARPAENSETMEDILKYCRSSI